MKKQSTSTLGRRYCIAYKDEKLRGRNRIVKKIAIYMYHIQSGYKIQIDLKSFWFERYRYISYDLFTWSEVQNVLQNMPL